MKSIGRGTGRRGKKQGAVELCHSKRKPEPEVADLRVLCEPDLKVEVCNRQRSVSVDTQRLAGLIRILLSELLGLRSAELSICLLGDHAIARLNEGYVGHAGPTDVITFDYRNTVSEGILAGAGKPELRGEICIGVHEARRQARRYRCDWSHEVVRYVIHGVLHLLGYDDGEVAARRRMKRLEDRLLQRLVARMGPLRLDRSFGASRRLVAGRVET